MFHRKKILKINFWKSCILAFAFLPLNSSAQQDPFELQVYDQLLAAGYIFISAGYELTHEPIIEKLQRGYYYDVTMNLQRGVSYAIVGVCDEDCYDMDLELYDSKGNLIDYDTGSTITPAVTVFPGYRDRFLVRVRIPRCAAWQCTFGIGVFGR